MTLVLFILVQVAWVLWNFSYIWLHPFSVHIFQIALDLSNYSAWQISGTDRIVYNYADRSTDLLYYIVSFIYSVYFIKELWYLKWVIGFIVFRIIGNIVYLITLQEVFLIVFPNIFEFLFVFYTFVDLVKIDHYFKIDKSLNILFILLISMFKIVSEIILHGIKKVDQQEGPSDTCLDLRTVLTLRYDLLVIAFIFTIYVGLTTFPSFEPKTVKRNNMYMFIKNKLYNQRY